jgi:predicted Zn-dependent protease
LSEAEVDLAERALAAADPGDGAQATVTRERSLLLRFAHSRPTQATAVDDLTVELTVLRDGHAGRATTNRAETEAVRDCGRRATAAAETAARASGSGNYPGFPDPGPIPAHDGHDPQTAALDPALGGESLAIAFSAAGEMGVEAHGIWTAAEVTRAIASSRGTAATDSVTDAFMKVVAIAPGGRSGYSAATSVAAGALDPLALAERAATKAAAAGEAAALPPGEYPVVMEHHAVGTLLSLLGDAAFNGLAHAEERGALVGKLGTRVAAPAINLSDSPRFRGTLPRAFDAEGVAKAPLPLIQDGVAHRVVHDVRSAALAGASTTGHALAPAGSPSGPLPTNLVLVGGGAADELELCRPIERGIYVTRLWYDNLVRPKETLVTAVTRDGTFLIEDGEPTRPLTEMRLTDSVLGILARTRGLGAEARLASDGEFYGRRFATGVVCPPLSSTDVRFTA